MAECCWTDCTEDAIIDLQMDAGESTCETCGLTKTNKTIFPLCQGHLDLYQETSDNHLMMVNATTEGE